MQKKSFEFTGVYPALITNFKKDGSLDLEAIKTNIKTLMDMGCAGMCVNGSTGEAASLTRDERIQIIKAALEAQNGEGKVIAGAGASVTSTTLELCRDAKEAGADALLILSPMANTTTEGLVKHFEAIDKIGLPIILYNHPAATGINITVEVFDRLIQIPNVIGMKETSGSLPLLAELMRKYKGYNVSLFSGADDLVLPAFATGTKATILATANVATKQVIDSLKLIQEGKIAQAQEIYYNLAPLTRIIGDETNFPAGIKKAVELLGRPAGNPRMPILPMPDEDVPALKEAMKIAGIL